MKLYKCLFRCLGKKIVQTKQIALVIMAKGSQRRPVRYEKDQLGCMWGLISIFDFRYGRSTQRLLSDRRRESRHANGKNEKILSITQKKSLLGW